MNKTNQTPDAVPSALEKKITAIIGLVSILLVLWGVVENHLFRFAFVLGGFCLAIIAVVFGALLKKGLGWFFSRGALRFHFWMIAGIFSVVVLFYAEEKWRGNRAWAALQKEAAARGESLELSSIIPPEVPDDLNFAKSEDVSKVLRIEAAASSESRAREEQSVFFHGKQQEWPMARWSNQEPTDFEKWAYFLATVTNGPISIQTVPAGSKTNAAEAVLHMLSRLNSSLDVLRKASSRPLCRYPIDYRSGWAQVDNRLYSILTDLRQANHALSLRASALLALGHTDEAADDIFLALRLAETLREEPFISAHYYRNQMLIHAVQPLWEGFASHSWNEKHLSRIREQFTALDPVADAMRGTRGETILTIDFAIQLENYLNGRTTPINRRFEEGEKTDGFALWLFRTFYPSGWLAQDRVWIYQFYRKYGAQRYEDGVNKLNNSTWGAELFAAMDPMLLVLVVPRMKEVCDEGVEWGTYLQTVRDQVLIATELELYRSTSNNRYPRSLDELVPKNLKSLPVDKLAGGKPLKYQTYDSTNFVLYSVGLNRRDDGGRPAKVENQQPLRLDKDDWVWTYR